MDDGGCGCLLGLIFSALVIFILYKIGGWVLSTFGIVGLVIYIVVLLNGAGRNKDFDEDDNDDNTY
jgi:hypothetical protein